MFEKQPLQLVASVIVRTSRPKQPKAPWRETLPKRPPLERYASLRKKKEAASPRKKTTGTCEQRDGDEIDCHGGATTPWSGKRFA